MLNYWHWAWGSQFRMYEFCLKLEMAHKTFFKVLEVCTKGNTVLKS